MERSKLITLWQIRKQLKLRLKNTRLSDSERSSLKVKLTKLEATLAKAPPLTVDEAYAI